MNKPLLTFCFFLLIQNTMLAQSNDAQLWENIYLEKKLNSMFALTLNEEGRIRNNVSDFNYVFTDFGFLTKVNKHIRASLDYLPLFSRSDTREHVKHQYYFFLKYKVKPFKGFAAEIREMYQIQYSDINSSITGDVPEHYLRSKVVLKYSPYYYPWDKFEPYFAFEAYYLLDNNAPNSLGFNRNRYFTGVFYEFNKRTFFELYYMIEVNFNVVDPPTNYV